MLLIADVELTSMGALLTQNPFDLGPLAAPITLFASVGVINAINMSDRIDGLSGVCVSISLGFIALLSFSTGSFVTGSFCLVTICSMAAFLLQNFRRLWHKKALVYLGDAGSTMLRFILAWLLISSTPGAPPSFGPVYALWFLAIPLFDTVNLIINRPLRENSTFSPGHDHLHHTAIDSRVVGETGDIFDSISIFALRWNWPTWYFPRRQSIIDVSNFHRCVQHLLPVL